MASLLLIAPIQPCLTQNGLAMRVASFVQGASALSDVQVAILPVAGSLPAAPSDLGPEVRASATTVTTTTTVPPTPGPVLRHQLTNLLADPAWRQLLAAADPLPPLARAASPARAADVIRASGATPGTPVHVVRSYLAPLGLAVAEELGSPWRSLDLDDDDEGFFLSQGDASTAAAYHRLVATFAPRFSAVSLASPVEARAVGHRHHLRTVSVPNAIALPHDTHRHRPSPGSGVLLFVGNLSYGPNVQAAVQLVEQVLPALQARMHRPVRVLLVGEHAPAGPIAALASRAGVTVTGFVDDLSSCYAQAEVVVAPFATGSGTRIKLLEAFAQRVPVVTTPVGAAGLAVRHREHVLIAPSLEGLVGATAELLTTPELAHRLTEAAFAFVRLHHDRAVVAHQVRGFLQSAAALTGSTG